MLSSLSFILRVLPAGEPPNLFRLIVYQTSYYFVEFQPFMLNNSIASFWGFLLPEDLKFGQISCLTSIFLLCEFQISMFSSLKV